jgi:hypothetical protein
MAEERLTPSWPTTARACKSICSSEHFPDRLVVPATISKKGNDPVTVTSVQPPYWLSPTALARVESSSVPIFSAEGVVDRSPPGPCGIDHASRTVRIIAGLIPETPCMQKTSPSRSASLWAITCYFNPMDYKTKLENFRIFRKYLSVPLVAIELAYDRDFELAHGDAELLIQLRGKSVLWQKERLLNVALDELPRSCTHVAWLDCDLIFLDEDWPERATELLRTSQLVQLFGSVHYLPPGTEPHPSGPIVAMFDRPGLARLVSEGRHFSSAYDDRSFNRLPGSASPGHAWASHRQLLADHGLYDACIIGGGDSALTCAAFGSFDLVIGNHRMNQWQRAHYLNWAEKLFNRVGAAVSFVPGDVLHLWHGDMRDRRTSEKYEGLRSFCFNPYEDIVAMDGSCWEWCSNKPDLHRYIGDYFARRREDG